MALIVKNPIKLSKKKKEEERFWVAYWTAGDGEVDDDLLLAVELVGVGLGALLEFRFRENLQRVWIGAEIEDEEEKDK